LCNLLMFGMRLIGVYNNRYNLDGLIDMEGL